MNRPVVGLCFSHRKLGNAELMAKVALNAAREAGAEVRLYLARNLDVKPCRGCLACVIKGRCPIDDQMQDLIRELDSAAGLILACPTYFLSPAASHKAVIDRFLMLGEWSRGAPERYAAVIGTAGKDDWAPMQLALLNIMPLMLRMKLLGSILACAPGPGETLLDPDATTAAADLGRRVAAAALGAEPEPDPVPPNACPVCRAAFFQPMPDGRFRCPVCSTLADLDMSSGAPVLSFDAESAADHRFTERRMKEHLTEWVMATGERFLARRAEIKELTKPYRNLDYER